MVVFWGMDGVGSDVDMFDFLFSGVGDMLLNFVGTTLFFLFTELEWREVYSGLLQHFD